MESEEQPLPAPDHAVSLHPRGTLGLVGFFVSVVPPTAMTVLNAAGLIDRAEAGVRARAVVERGKAELAAIGVEVRLGVRVVEGVDDRHRPAGAVARRERGQRVRALKIGGEVAALWRGGSEGVIL